MLALTRFALLQGADICPRESGHPEGLGLEAPRRRDGRVQRQTLQGHRLGTAQVQLDVLRISVKSGPGVGSGSRVDLMRPCLSSTKAVLSLMLGVTLVTLPKRP